MNLRARSVALAALVCLAPAAAEQKERPMAGESGIPTGLVLADVPRTGSFDPTKSTTGTEETALPSYLRACLQAMGDDRDLKRLGRDWHNVYVYLMGTSGAAFRLLWDAKGWSFEPMLNGALLAADPSEPARRALESVGCSGELILRRAYAEETGFGGLASDDEPLYRSRIVESLRGGRPVIAFGLSAPPDTCLVVGYDEGGETLIARGFLRDEALNGGAKLDALGYFRKRDWFGETRGILVLGKPGERPPQKEIHRRALQGALQVLRTPEVRGVASGLAAYDAWAESLRPGADLSAGDPKLLEARYQAHRYMLFQLVEARLWGAEFLRQLGSQEPAAKEDLASAAACLEATHDLMWETAALTSFHWLGEELKRFTDPAKRRRMVDLLHQAKAKDTEAARHIEHALAK